MCFAERERKSTDIRPIREDGVTGIFVPGYGKDCHCWYQLFSLDYVTRVAINVEQHSLPPFAGIVPCGLTRTHGQVVCVNDLVEHPITVADRAHYMRRALEQVLAIQLVRLADIQTDSDTITD